MQIIPRKVLFGNPDKAGVQISPDGQYLSYLAPVNGVLNIHVANIKDIQSARPITNDASRGIRSYFWLYDNKTIVYLQDDKGNEDWHAHIVDIEVGETKNITPFEKVRAVIQGVSYKSPHEFILGLNKRDPSYFDLYKFNTLTGNLDLFYENTENFLNVQLDDEYKLRFAYKPTSEGGCDVYKFTTNLKTELFFTINAEDFNTTYILEFDKEGNGIYLSDARNRDTSALIHLDLRTQKQEILSHHAKSDLGKVLIHPTEKTIQAVAHVHKKTHWNFLDDIFKKDFDTLQALEHGEVEITSRTLDDNKWVVAFLKDDAPINYYLYDRTNKESRFLFNNRSDLLAYELAPMHPVIIHSRDELEMVSYLTLPLNSVANKEDLVPLAPVPLILNVHGGPTVRDHWGLNASHQWLANRGYAVLSVNYRGSSGFGKSFINAGYGEWGAKMHDDLIDAVKWAIDQKITTKEQVAIYGGSYGGYAVLVGLTFTPEVFACGVDIVGVSNLVTLLKSIPSYWRPFYNDLVRKLGGDPETEAGLEFLKSRSPLTFADRIIKPLLIGHGAHDPRVKQAESDQIVSAMQEKNIPVTYVVYSDEGHGFARPENRISFYAITEQFLAAHLGGKSEPTQDDFINSSMEIKTGHVHSELLK